MRQVESVLNFYVKQLLVFDDINTSSFLKMKRLLVQSTSQTYQDKKQDTLEHRNKNYLNVGGDNW